MILQFFDSIRRGVERIFYREPAVGEFITCLGGLVYIFLAVVGDEEYLPRGIVYLSSFGKSAEFWYGLGILGFSFQLIGLWRNYKWIRWGGAVLVASWWLNISLALMYASGAVPVLPIYLCLAVLNVYVVNHLIWKD